VFKHILEKSLIEVGEYSVVISIFGKKQSFKGFVDTGNFLKDPFSDIPVIVCGFSDAMVILPKDLKHIIEKGETLDATKIMSLDEATRKSLRLIPYSAVGKKGVIPALRADFIEIISENKMFIAPNVYLAVSNEKIGGGDYNLLLSPQLMKLSYSKNNLNIN
ncbi:MAG: sigma-E processing peptidase SpoIIGA, partial [Oscillospiraceae bacterium]